MEVVKDSKDERAIAVANLSRAEVLSLFGETRDSVSAARRACDIFRRRGDSQQLSMALMLAARGFLELGPLAKQRALSHKGVGGRCAFIEDCRPSRKVCRRGSLPFQKSQGC
eukprot:g15115.t1